MPVPLGEGFRGPEGRVGYLLRQAQHALRLAMDASLRNLGITVPQFQILGVIQAEPGLSGAELARDSMLTPQSVNELVVTIERAGLIERRPHPRDGRVRAVHLTPEGQRTIAAAKKRVYAVEHQMVSGLSADEQRLLRTWLVECAKAVS